MCNFDFVLFWFGIWCESPVWVIMGWRGVSQNAGVLVVLVWKFFRWRRAPSAPSSISALEPSIYIDVACEVSSDRLGSDHHPIITTANTSDHPVPERVSKWNFKTAKYDAFQDQCITVISHDLFNDADDKKTILSSTLLDIAPGNIPKTSPFPKRKAKSGSDEDCQPAKKERNKANRLANKHPVNSMRVRLIQARTKMLFKLT